MIVKTKYGQVHGVREGTLNVFRGIPYAEPPIGERRFSPPSPPKAWDGVLQADRFSPLSHQPVQWGGNDRVQSEDCLTLNIWSPDLEQAERPVLVDIHGGGFTTGTGADFKGFTFAERDNMVCVSFNYRLGALGFLYLGDLLGEAYLTSGNNGILDIVAALRWIKENISAFGGDPNRITISGGSAGAKCASTLLAVPAAQGLFHQIIAQSGAAQAIRDTRTASRLTLQLLDKLGIPIDDAQRLLTLPAQTILEAQDNGLHTFGPVRDGIIVSMEPIDEILKGLDREIPMLLGSNKDEAAIFTSAIPQLKEPNDEVLNALFGLNGEFVWAAYRKAALSLPASEAWSRTLTDYIYRIATIRLAETAAKQGQPLWLYRFEFTTGLGAIHALESPFVIDSRQSDTQHDQAADSNPMASLYEIPTSGRKLAADMHAAWAAFIHSGKPFAEGLPEWPMFDLSERVIMLLNEECRLDRDPELQDQLFPHEVIVLGESPASPTGMIRRE